MTSSRTRLVLHSKLWGITRAEIENGRISSRARFAQLPTIARGQRRACNDKIFGLAQSRDRRGVPTQPAHQRSRIAVRMTETYSIPFCVHQGTMEPMRQVAPALWRQDSKNSWIFGSSSSYSICVPPSLTLTSIGLSSPSATKL